MDCCGMAMAVREGGGLMCRRCGNAVGVPIEVRRNPFDVAVTEAPMTVPEPVVIPGLIPEAVSVGAAVSLSGVPRGTPEASARGRSRK